MKKRALIGLIGLAFAGMLAGAALPWSVTGERIGEQASGQINQTAGFLFVSPPTRMTLSLLPRPRVKLEQIALRSQDGAASISAPEAKANLRLSKLLTGRVEVSSLTLFEPKIEVEIGGGPAGSVLEATALDGAAAAASRPNRLEGVKIVDGDLTVLDKTSGVTVSATGLEAALDWPTSDSPASITASGIVHGENTSVTGWIGDPSALTHGAGSPVRLDVESRLLSARFDGAASRAGAFRYDGTLEAEAGSLAAAARWLGVPHQLPNGLGRANVAGKLTANGLDASLSELTLEIAGSQFEGEAAWSSKSPRPLLSATLASESLGLTPLLQNLPRLSTPDGSWSQDPLPTDFGPADLDIRVSAARAKIDRLLVADMGLSILLVGKRLEIVMPEAKAYGGRVSGRLTLDRTEAQQTVSGVAALHDVDMGSFFAAARGVDLMEGLAKANISLDSQGASIADLVRAIKGKADFDVSNGSLVGIDFEQALRRIDKRPLSVALDVHGGRTAFSSLSGQINLADDRAQLSSVSIAGPGARIDVSGYSRLEDRSIDIKATAQQAGVDGAPSVDGSRFSFAVTGFWDDPRLYLDAASLVRRSEAAASLFPRPAAATAASGAP